MKIRSTSIPAILLAALAVMPPSEDKAQRERDALVGILRERIIYHAAREASVELSRAAW